MQEGIPTTEYFVRLSDLKQPIERNPYDKKEGNISAYMRYLKYNTKMADVRGNVHGEWLPGKEVSRTYEGKRLTGIAYMNFDCSNCGYIVWEGTKPEFNFCPNCGADMRKGKET